MQNERLTIDRRALRAGWGVSLPPGFFDPLEQAQAGLDAALVAQQNEAAAKQSPDTLRSALNGAGWLLLSDSEREALRQ